MLPLKLPTTLPDPQVCERALLAKDPRFDGRFFVAVKSTGIYCRPVCPARTPARANISFYPTAAAAQDAGYRPCLRCRPERARPGPEWLVSPTVVKGLRLIDNGFLNEHPVAKLASRLGLSTRQLNRIFVSELGATPKSLARQHRIQLAKRLIDDTTLPLTEVGMAAGFGSVRRFNAEMKQAYRRPPRELRRSGGPTAAPITLHLPVHLPYNVDWVFGFHHKRALAGIESVCLGRKPSYQRQIDRDLCVRVTWQDDDRVRGRGKKSAASPPGLVVEFRGPVGDRLVDYLARVRRMFDVTADSQVIDAHLLQDPHIGAAVARAPGLRVPGAWDGFEQAVRAILGQQVSVARATDLAVKMIDRYGDGTFPTPDALIRATPAEIGMPGNRGRAISMLAEAVASGDVDFDAGVQTHTLTEQLCAIKGIGPWTAGYIAMRIARDPDALPDKDWVVLKQLDATGAEARAIADAWRPWRAYGVMYTWYASSMNAATQAT